MSEKKYLDLEGLTQVAQNVNTRLKTVATMPETADAGAIRLYVGEDNEKFGKGHTYKAKGVTYYAWDGTLFESPITYYTTDEEPTVESIIYTRQAGEILPGDEEEEVKSYSDGTLVVGRYGGYEVTCTYNESGNVVQTEWEDISTAVPIYYKRSSAFTWGDIIEYRDKLFLIALDNGYTISTYICTFSPYINYRQPDRWTAQSGGTLIIVTKDSFGKIGVFENNLLNPKVPGMIKVYNESGQFNLQPREVVGAVFKSDECLGENSSPGTILPYAIEIDEVSVGDEVYQNDGYCHNEEVTEITETNLVVTNTVTGATRTVSKSSLYKNNWSVCYNPDATVFWCDAIPPTVVGMHFIYDNNDTSEGLVRGKLYKVEYDTEDEEYVYTELNLPVDEEARETAAGAMALATEALEKAEQAEPEPIPSSVIEDLFD